MHSSPAAEAAGALCSPAGVPCAAAAAGAPVDRVSHGGARRAPAASSGKPPGVRGGPALKGFALFFDLLPTRSVCVGVYVCGRACGYGRACVSVLDSASTRRKKSGAICSNSRAGAQRGALCKSAGQGSARGALARGRAGARGALHAMPWWWWGSVAAKPRRRFATSKPQPLARRASLYPNLAFTIGASLKQHAAKRWAQLHPYRGFDFSRCKAGAPGSPPSKPLPRPCLGIGRTKAARRAPQGTQSHGER